VDKKRREARRLVDDSIDYLTGLLLKLGVNAYEAKRLIREKLRD